jgi:uncharacterized protein (TIGR02599 family)
MKRFLSKFIVLKLPDRRPGNDRSEAFTMIELLVAMVILSIIILVCFQMISGTSGVWSKASSQMAEGRAGRVAFNSLVSHLSQATVDQYYGYTWTTSGVPNQYVRHAELRFISGLGSAVNTSVASCPTDAVFFVAPLGVVTPPSTAGAPDYRHLPSLLNICGYYVQWTNSDPDRPSILPSSSLPYSFKLMQFVQPSEQMSLYASTATGYPTYTTVTPSPAWQNTALANSPSGIRPIATNVVALLLLPAMSTTDTSGSISPGFKYDSGVAWTSATASTTAANRLPPVMRVVMYTIDDVSAKRLGNSSTMPNLYVDTSGNTLFTDPTKLYANASTSDIGDLARFEASLTSKNLRFRRFESAVELPRQPWNTQN